MSKVKVSIVKGHKNPNSNQIEADVRKAIQLVGGLEDIKSGDVVIIKPNVFAPTTPRSAKCTNPAVAKAIADVVRETGATAIIAEAAAVFNDDTEGPFRASGYDKLRLEGYEVVDLKGKNTALTKVSIPEGRVLKEVTLPKIVLDAKMIISVPVMKTHAGQKVTLSLKNMKGILPDAWKKKFHTTYGVTAGLVDLLGVMKPGFAIVDGILAQEGLGPMLGTLVEMGLIIAGKDAVAVDAVTSTIMGFHPEEIPLVDGASKAGLGTADLNEIQIVGTSIKEVQRRFKRAEEAVEETIPFPTGLQVLIGEKACTGCRECFLGAIWEMKAQNSLDKLSGWTVVAGQTQEIPIVNKDKLLLVGACTAKHKQIGIFVPGCPPQPWDIADAVT